MSAAEPVAAKSALRIAMEARDINAVLDTFAPDAVFHSPFTEKLTFRGRAQMTALISVIFEVFEGFHYVDEVVNETSGALTSRATVEGVEIEMVDHFRLGPDGKITESTVFMRPLPAAAAALRRMGRGLVRRKSEARAALFFALASPLAFMTRTGDGIGVQLIRSAL